MSIIINKQYYRNNESCCDGVLMKNSEKSILNYSKKWNNSAFLFRTIISITLLILHINLVNTTEHLLTPTWVVHIHNDVPEMADQIAKDNGFINLGSIMVTSDDGSVSGNYYHFQHKSAGLIKKMTKRSITTNHYLSKNNTIHIDLLKDNRIRWAEQQKRLIRKKRDYIINTNQEDTENNISTTNMNDPLWSKMWYLNRRNNLDMNVIPAWEKGYTGKGVISTLLDDGIERTHTDLIDNYDPQASYDLNDNDPDPMMRYTTFLTNSHGTQCAGEIAASANNSVCGVGIAYGSRIGAIRMLDGDITDALEARSLSFNRNYIDIYSASWGPEDNARTVDGPGKLTKKALIEGVEKGRNGLGSIFVWASGNGGLYNDDCNCDGYTNSIWTITISSTNSNGDIPRYSEHCSSTLATTYSYDNFLGGWLKSLSSSRLNGIVTTNALNSCTMELSGTSASAPMAAGIIALTLEANMNLTWRDIQYIIIRTAKPDSLDQSNWQRNGVGRQFNHWFGYGLMDASAMVDMAINWKTVPEQQNCTNYVDFNDKFLITNSTEEEKSLWINVTRKNCANVKYLEHVQVVITLSTKNRGAIQIFITSPSGTKTQLLVERNRDKSDEGFIEWSFMTVHMWDEKSIGLWKLSFLNSDNRSALLYDAGLVLYGTKTIV